MSEWPGDLPDPNPPRWAPWLILTLVVVAGILLLGLGAGISFLLAAELAVLALVLSCGWLVLALHQFQRQMTAALGLASERLSRTIDGAPIGLALVGLDGRWLRINAALSRMIGYDQAALLQKTFQDITHPDDLATDLRQLNETIEGKRAGYVMEKRYFHRDGHIVPVELHVSLVRDASGTPVHFVSQIVDLTARMATERALRREEAAFAALVEEADDIIIRYGADHRIRYANPATSRGSGIDPQTLIGHRVEELGLDRELAERWNAALARVLATGTVESLEYSYPHPDGGPREWLARFAPERGVDGRPIGVFAVSRDITELQAAAGAMRQQQMEFRALAENAEEQIVRYDLAGRCRYANPAALELIDRTLGEVLGRKTADLQVVPDDIARAWEARNTEAIRTRQAVRQTVTLDRPDGRRTYEASAIPEFDSHGRATSVLVISRDITVQQRATDELARREQEWLALRTTETQAFELERARLVAELAESNAALPRERESPQAE